VLNVDYSGRQEAPVGFNGLSRYAGRKDTFTGYSAVAPTAGRTDGRITVD